MSGPSIWTSPFEAAVAALGNSDPQTITGALAAAAEAETEMRRGFAAAHNWWPSMIEYLRGYFAVRFEQGKSITESEADHI